MNKFLALILVIAFAFAGVCQAASVAEDWYVADLVRVNGKPMVCPPGVEATGKTIVRRSCGSHDPLSPNAYIQAMCPGASLVSVQPVFVPFKGISPSLGINPIRLVIGFTHPSNGNCPQQTGRL